MNGLAALEDDGPPVRIVVLNNDGGGIFEFLPQAEHIEREEFEAILGTPLGIEPAKVAELHGLRHTRVGDIGELARTTGAGTAITEVPVDRRANVQVHRRIADRAADALSAISR
jgi:2-succinyl-5-enolpyruvyl-6-hydroxy-3-cyclohexene-1-carboxylate synthase